jgi:hypothetical protein
MTSDPIDALRGALALTTTLLQESQEEGAEWVESIAFAEELLQQHGTTLLMAQAHLTTRFLTYAADLAQATQEAGVDVDGIPGGTTPESLLQEYGRQMLEHELDHPDDA